MLGVFSEVVQSQCDWWTRRMNWQSLIHSHGGMARDGAVPLVVGGALGAICSSDGHVPEQATKAIEAGPGRRLQSSAGDVARVIEARHAAARSVNAVMTATYWLVGRRIVEQDQGGQARASYGEALLERLSADLTSQCDRGFSVDNLETMRAFFLAYQPAAIFLDGISEILGHAKIRDAFAGIPRRAGRRFRLSWSHPHHSAAYSF